MSEQQHQIPDLNRVVGWSLSQWILALLIGAWGAMIGVGRHTAADVLCVASCAFAALRVVIDAFFHRSRNWLILSGLGLIAVTGVCAYTIHWTSGLRIQAKETETRLAQLGLIPTLQNQILQLSKDNAIASAKGNQRLEDIHRENGDLKQSIEKKDAVLASIAQEQYALNFFPQVIVTRNGTIDKTFITNNGKTTVYLTSYRVDEESRELSPAHAIVANSSETFTDGADAITVIRAKAASERTSKVNYDGLVTFRTEDKKLYTIAFTVTYVLSDTGITASFADQTAAKLVSEHAH